MLPISTIIEWDWGVVFRIKSAVFVAVGVGIALGQGAFAADLPRKAPAYVPPAPPPYVWTGCYIGANVGAAFAHIDVTDVATGASGSRTSNTGFAGGGQIGCDYQINSWVIGVRNMFDGTSITAAEHLLTRRCSPAPALSTPRCAGSMF